MSERRSRSIHPGTVLKRTGGELVDDCDGCPEDRAKTSPDLCGCGVSDIDSDSDTIPDCNDQCPGEDDRLDDNGNDTPDRLEHGPIPAVSEWGLVLLALALVVVGWIYFSRRELRRATRLRIKSHDR